MDIPPPEPFPEFDCGVSAADNPWPYDPTVAALPKLECTPVKEADPMGFSQVAGYGRREKNDNSTPCSTNQFGAQARTFVLTTSKHCAIYIFRLVKNQTNLHFLT